MKRRQFAKAAASGTLAAFAVSTGLSQKSKRSPELIDIHQHVNFLGRYNKALVDHQDRMGVTKTVLLPSGAMIARSSTNGGRANGLAARVYGTEASARLAKQYPDRFVYFCNEVPDKPEAVAELEKWLKRGALGIGESKFKLECDSAPMQKIYEVASEFEVPVLLHFEHKAYNTGFERFHKMLEKYPKVNFIGHAQTWWGNIDANHQQEVMYPKGPVKAGGLTDRYLADYPNMFADLSAGSGKNALSRDEKHAIGFLERHQDKICLGTDCADIEGQGDSCSGTGQIDNVRRFVKDEKVLTKILSGNAKKIIRLS